MRDYKTLLAELSIGDVVEITGVPLGTLDRWASEGTLRPSVRGGNGRGSQRRFSFVDCVAAALGAAHREHGVGHRWVSGVVKRVATLSLEELEAAVTEGRTTVLPLTSPPWGLLLPPTNPEDDGLGLNAEQLAEAKKVAAALDLRTALEKVFNGVAELAKRPPNREGRNRGLPGTRLNGHGDRV